MGVPAFFRWLSRKYPSIVVNCVEEKVRDGRGCVPGLVCLDAFGKVGLKPTRALPANPPFLTTAVAP
ncbi:hypothetical protein chiPu_0027437 [Chiloscyllium punctatum]|uniref:Xrn1 N-terminal domain-containing protein n=1 Tax=Chiloscyllium punctatum TaxID=137246 RepID=A0A401TLU1_CHIPU|nr:hypothetical protein [Chiloscyllium punctatum]